MGRRHKEGSVLIAASPEIVFAYVDDHSRLSSHMNESSWMMGGGGMSLELDAAKGQAVGSPYPFEWQRLRYSIVPR